MKNLAVALPALLMLLIGPAGAAVVGQVDTFEDGSTQGWIVGLLGAPHPTPPANVASGGPAGADDNYLRLTAVGNDGPGSRLSALNLGQWTGNYIDSGIAAIALDARNSSGSDLTLRLLFEDAMGGPPTNVAVSQGVLVPSGSGWTRIVIPISVGSLTALTGSVENVLANTTVLRLFHSSTATFPPPSIAASVDIDNIAALGIPEPATTCLFALGLASLVALKRKRTRV